MGVHVPKQFPKADVLPGAGIWLPCLGKVTCEAGQIVFFCDVRAGLNNPKHFWLLMAAVFAAVAAGLFQFLPIGWWLGAVSVFSFTVVLGLMVSLVQSNGQRSVKIVFPGWPKVQVRTEDGLVTETVTSITTLLVSVGTGREGFYRRRLQLGTANGDLLVAETDSVVMGRIHKVLSSQWNVPLVRKGSLDSMIDHATFRELRGQAPARALVIEKHSTGLIDTYTVQS